MKEKYEPRPVSPEEEQTVEINELGERLQNGEKLEDILKDLPLANKAIEIATKVNEIVMRHEKK